MTTNKIPVIALDAGHGINTSGKRTPDGIREWTLNDKVRDKAAAILSGYVCKIIYPDNNEGNTDETLASRKKMYVVADADAAVSIHHNAYKGVWSKTVTGLETYVDKKYTKADMELAKCIHTRMVKNIGLKDRGIKKENWTVINQNTVPAVLTEGGFMDSRIDNPVITSNAGQEAYAKAIAEGLIEFLKLEKKSSTSTSSTAKPSSTLYKVQCGAYSKKANANNQAKALKKAGFSNTIVLEGGLYKVQCGAFAKQANASALRSKIKAAGFDAVITTSGTSTKTTTSTPKATLKVGSTVVVKKGAKDYDGASLASFVYKRNHKVYSIKGNRVVISYNGAIVAAVHKSNLTVK